MKPVLDESHSLETVAGDASLESGRPVHVRFELGPQQLKRSLSEIQCRLDEIERGLQPSSEARAGNWIEQAHCELMSAGMDEALSHKITEKALTAWEALSPARRSTGTASFRRILVDCVVNELRFIALPKTSGAATPPALIFAGPPGAGKTTTLAKIAIREYLNCGVPAHIISADPHHPSSHEKLRALASTAGASFAPANTMDEFAQALRDFHGLGTVLIDTPGYAGPEQDGLREVADWLTLIDARQTHLVLPAWITEPELVSYVRQYDSISVDALIFTQLDETDAYGAIVSAALEVSKPLSYFATGQNIPEDILTASPRAVFESLFHGRRIEAAVANPCTRSL